MNKSFAPFALFRGQNIPAAKSHKMRKNRMEKESAALTFCRSERQALGMGGGYIFKLSVALLLFVPFALFCGQLFRFPLPAFCFCL
jgi:hypothetical protein